MGFKAMNILGSFIFGCALFMGAGELNRPVGNEISPAQSVMPLAREAGTAEAAGAFDKGVALIKKTEYEKAVESFTKAIQLKPRRELITYSR